MAANNVELQPGDTVIVPRAGIVYVLGEVNKPGGYVMNSTGGSASCSWWLLLEGRLGSRRLEKRDSSEKVPADFKNSRST